MISAIKYLILVVSVISLLSCGHRKAPTGGKVDTEKPEVVSITPEPFSELEAEIIEVTFSKPIDRSSVYAGERGLYIYPLIDNKRYRWSDNTLRIEINEPLKQDRNYYLSLSKTIRDLRNNNLEKDYLYVYHTGVLSNNRISGAITFEREEDIGSEITINVLSADSIRIFTQRITGSRYNIDYLNDEPHVIRAFIDKNNNNRYDVGREPFFQTKTAKATHNDVSIHLEYFDDTKPEILSSASPHKRLLLLNMNKPVTQIGDISINSADSLRKELKVIDYDFIDNRIEIVTAKMDSLRYEVVLESVQDGKNNTSDILKTDFNASLREDDEPLRIVGHSPRDGAVVETLNPALTIKFSKFIFAEDIDFQVIDTITNKEIPFRLTRSDSRSLLLFSENPLAGRQTYKLSILETTKDTSGNTLEETFELNFLPIAYR